MHDITSSDSLTKSIFAMSINFFNNIEEFIPKEKLTSLLSTTDKILIVATLAPTKIKNFVDGLEKFISSYSIHPSNIYALLYYKPSEEALYEALKERNIESIHIQTFNTWLRVTKDITNSDGQLMHTLADNYPISKKFCILSRRFSSDRLQFFFECIKFNLLEDSYFTFSHIHPDGVASEETTIEAIRKSIPEDLSVCQDKVNKWIDGIPYQIQSSFQDAFPVEAYEYMFGSKIHIVLETHVFPSSDLINLTEKTFKAIITKKPFLIYGIPNILSALRKCGYQTFHPLINETYDTVEDIDLRRGMILDEMNKLNNMSEEELDSFIEKCKPVIEHNYRHMLESNNPNLDDAFKALGIF
jgi:hypothetical protein